MEKGVAVGGYWRRRRSEYRRLDGSSSSRGKNNNVQVATFGSANRRPARFWKIKIKPKFRFFRRFRSPKNLFIRLRDAYVKMMIGLGNSSVFASGYGGGGAALGFSDGFGKPPVKEYDDKMIVEIYKSVMLQRQLECM